MQAIVNGRLIIASKTDVGMRRSENQDSMLVAPVAASNGGNGGDLLAVADGVGGGPGGQLASQQTLHSLAELANQQMINDPLAALRQGFLTANAAVRQLTEQQPELVGMASTLTAAFVRENQAWLANAGDSRVYLVRSRNAFPMTHDHSWVATQVEAGRMTAQEAVSHPRRNMITRAIGIEATLEPDVYKPIALEDGDLLLLCSDGLYGVVSDPEMAAVCSDKPPEIAVEELVALANERGGPDNITVIVAQYVADAAAETIQALSADLTEAQEADTVERPVRHTAS